MQSNASAGWTSKMQPVWISKDPYITEEKGKLIKWEGGGIGVCALGFWRFEDFKWYGNDGGRERVLVPWSHGDKRIGEWSGPALF